MAYKKSQTGMMPYFREFFGAMVVYVVVLFATIPFRDAADATPVKVLWALAPVLPLVLVFWAVVRQYNRMDEMMQRMQSEAFALGAIILGFATVSWGFVETAGLPRLPTILVGPALVALWGLCLPIVMRKYR